MPNSPAATKGDAAASSPRGRKRTPKPKTSAHAESRSPQPADGPPRIRPHTIRIAGFDDAATHLARRYGMPVLPDATDAMLWAPDILEQAVAERRIVGLIGEKGTGKTVAVDCAVPRHEEAERIKRLADDRYEPERVVVVQCPETASYRELVVAIYTGAFDVPPIERVRGRLKDDTVLLTEVVDRLRDENVAVIILDEAELLTFDGFAALRKLNSLAEARAPRRYNSSGDKLPAGVGIVLLGTYDLDIAIGSWNEDGQRTGRVRYLGGIAAGDVPSLYRRLLPAFELGGRELDEAGWAAIIRQEVTHGFALPIRFIENHIRGYVRRMAEQCVDVRAAEDLPFDAAQFSYTAREIRRPRGCRVLASKADHPEEAGLPGDDDADAGEGDSEEAV